ncbi:acetyl-CoA C-acyltransferase [Alkalibaculum sp. M08DMB]|uniref:Acetyl-CoA acetyltransferase n=1 Tax=Alkalibaculum sporogenes TaxID=2655001 RepID=A0A6A7KAJ5_9FIRM|nr:thiolase family protein [Alkalibaculum sporogenes]MPW26530.1 acetyl-CoA C-acyltransferase [Alkalibaculum sporogenes]
MVEEVVIIGMARTPIGNFMGSLKSLSAVDLGVIAVNEAIKKSGIRAEQVEDVVAGMVYKAGAKGNPARQIAIACGIPVESPAVTVEQQCASSMRALEIATHQIKLGIKEICVVTGIESMSNVPYLLSKGREGFRMGDSVVNDGLLYDALTCAFTNVHQGVGAETLASSYSITREEQDELALLSNMRAVAAIKDGKFKEEIVPIEIKTKRGTIMIDTDERPNADTTIESLAGLRPVFKKDGTVTSGNASGINDGACAVVLMSERKAKELGVNILAKVISTASVGVPPEIMGVGPVYAIPKSIELAGLHMSDIDYFEINEAFAVQFLAVKKELNLSMENTNANGSGIALGHPVGCTSLRLVISMINELKRRDNKYGVASLCAGGGPAMAAVIENIK